jgi:type I restriction enzyme M protein
MPRRALVGSSDKGRAVVPTTVQSLGALLKSARDIMRKDKGLNGDLDRLPLLTWIMFLKFLDDLEQQREDEAKLAGKPFRAALERPYRWRDWAAQPDGVTGDELLAFISQDEVRRPDGKKGAGLFKYLRALESSNGDTRRDVIATVFKGVDNRMRSGYLLKDVINKINSIHFTSSEELHTLGALYESMLREVRDAAGDSGEFYTPRPVVRFMVRMLDPRLGETVLDPAAGTGGFLVEALGHVGQQVKTVKDRSTLQQKTLVGCEPKPLPYLLCQMNLLLHGLDAPNIDPGNALAVKLTEIGERDRVDVILTNPPFGGEEEKGIQGNFPEDRQSSETALLFLQLIMRRLRRSPTAAGRSARAAVVVPNGTLFATGVAARIREDLLKEFNLHTIIRLPNGVFAPYTPIPTNILMFDRSGPTREVWYYDQPLPTGRRNYSKTQPMQFEELRPCIEWFQDRKENERAWSVSAQELLASGCDLDRKHPAAAANVTYRTPTAILSTLFSKEQEVLAAMQGLLTELDQLPASASCTLVPMHELVTLREPDTEVQPSEAYHFAGVYSFGRGVFPSQTKTGMEFAYKRLTQLHTGDFVYPKLMAWEGALGTVPSECEGLVVSPEFPVFAVNSNRVLPDVLDAYFRNPSVWPQIASISTGTNVRRRRLHPASFLKYRFPVPPMQVQWVIQQFRRQLKALQSQRLHLSQELETLLPSVLNNTFSKGTDFVEH